MEFLTTGIPTPIALSLVAIAGYLVGRFSRKRKSEGTLEASRELKRARAVIRELECISQQVRRNLASHHSSIVNFKERLRTFGHPHEGDVCQDLSDEAERMLQPTLRLSTQIAHAYDEIRQQTNLLMSFTEIRTDPLTGLRNRRALDESLNTLFAMCNRYGARFSIAMFDVDHFKQINDNQGHLQGDHVLQQLAAELEDCVRDTDLVSRFGGEEFIVVMPETTLDGAKILAERARKSVEERLSVTISGGLAQATNGETPDQLIGRADEALYGAKAAGRNTVFEHDGSNVQRAEPKPNTRRAARLNDAPATSVANEHPPKATDSAPKSEAPKPPGTTPVVPDLGAPAANPALPTETAS